MDSLVPRRRLPRISWLMAISPLTVLTTNRECKAIRFYSLDDVFLRTAVDQPLTEIAETIDCSSEIASINVLAASPDGRIIAVSGVKPTTNVDEAEHVLLFYDAESGQLLHESLIPFPSRHNPHGTHMEFWSNTEVVLVCGTDKNQRCALVNVVLGRTLAGWRGPCTGSRGALMLTPVDTDKIRRTITITGGQDDTVRIVRADL